MSLNNKSCITHALLIIIFYLNFDEFNQGLRYNLNRFNETCNTLDDLSNTIRVPNKIED